MASEYYGQDGFRTVNNFATIRQQIPSESTYTTSSTTSMDPRHTEESDEDMSATRSKIRKLSAISFASRGYPSEDESEDEAVTNDEEEAARDGDAVSNIDARLQAPGEQEPLGTTYECTSSCSCSSDEGDSFYKEYLGSSRSSGDRDKPQDQRDRGTHVVVVADGNNATSHPQPALPQHITGSVSSTPASIRHNTSSDCTAIGGIPGRWTHQPKIKFTRPQQYSVNSGNGGDENYNTNNSSIRDYHSPEHRLVHHHHHHHHHGDDRPGQHHHHKRRKASRDSSYFAGTTHSPSVSTLSAALFAPSIIHSVDYNSTPNSIFGTPLNSPLPSDLLHIGGAAAIPFFSTCSFPNPPEPRRPPLRRSRTRKLSAVSFSAVSSSHAAGKNNPLRNRASSLTVIPTSATVDALSKPFKSLNTSTEEPVPSFSYFPDELPNHLYNNPNTVSTCHVSDMVAAQTAGRSLAVTIRDSPPEGLPNISLLDVLATDPRPTFILGTASSSSVEHSLQTSTTIYTMELEVVYHNDAFSSILPDAAFSTVSVDSGHSRTTFNITDVNFHRWISGSLSSLNTNNGYSRPYVCPDAILWSQTPVVGIDGTRMVMISGVPLPSSGENVKLEKGDHFEKHEWERLADATRTASVHGDHEANRRQSLAANTPNRMLLDGHDGLEVSNVESTPVLQHSNVATQGTREDFCPSLKLSKEISVVEPPAPRLVRVDSSNFTAEPPPTYFYQEIAADMDAAMTISSPKTSRLKPGDDSRSRSATPMDETHDSPLTDGTEHAFPNASTYSPHLLSDSGFFDWTRVAPSVKPDAYTEMILSVDWTKTGYGPMEEWPQSLRTMINLVLSSPHPAAMYWGPEFSISYNEAYIPLIGSKHPNLLGQRYQDGWAEIWDSIEPFFKEAVTTGKPINKEDDRLFIVRDGFREETYFSWSICPIIGEDGTVIGLHNPAFEKTRRVIAERRMLTLREVGERASSARELKSYWRTVLSALETNPWDAPFAILYSCKRPESFDSETASTYASSFSNSRIYVLEGSLGVKEGHLAAPSIVDLKSINNGFSVAFRQALQIEGNIFLSTDAGTLPEEIMEGIDFRGFSEDKCTAAVVCPIYPSGDGVLGFLILGINPRRPFDEDYRLYIQLLTRQLTSSVAGVVLFEEEVKRNQKAARIAALDKVELSQQLALKSKEAEHSQLKFIRMAEFAPVGIFISDFKGNIQYYNDMFLEISGHPKNSDPSQWLDTVDKRDLELTEANWFEVINGKRRKTWEFRWKDPWCLSKSHNDLMIDRWTLLSASPEVDADGALLGVFGSITNISEVKHAEDLQKRRVEEVVELKRQQDNFVDMASHELRNPLSAILQGADALLGSLERYRELPAYQDTLDDIDASIDVAQTISLCALHQKRVVDDILTLSKLDSEKLSVTPVDVQPVLIVNRAFKMFEQEALASETSMTFRIDESYRQMHLDWVKLDPARLMQVLINLLTNALKFLRTEPSKSIIVTISASQERPSNTDTNNELIYFPSTRKVTDMTTGPDWGDGDVVFLSFSVMDTGKGLTPAEKKNLFKKFSQATAKTEVSYGGSGLGLFICKELVSIQSGEIGVQSGDAGKGCVFSFYIKTRRSERPEVEVPQAPLLRTTSNTSSKRSSGATPASPQIALASESSPTINPPRSIDSPRPAPVPKKTVKKKLDYTVLIVEDNLVNQKLLKRALDSSGCKTFVANHGVEALDIIRQTVYWKDAKEGAHPLSIILMDCEMPIMDGLTCSKRIRELQSEGSILRHIPIIAVSANARQAQIENMLEAGMDDVVSKPYRITELIPKLDSVVNRYRDVNDDCMTD